MVERVAALAESAVHWARALSEARQGPGLQAAVSYCMCTAVSPPHANAGHRPSAQARQGAGLQSTDRVVTGMLAAPGWPRIWLAEAG